MNLYTRTNVIWNETFPIGQICVCVFVTSIWLFCQLPWMPQPRDTERERQKCVLKFLWADPRCIYFKMSRHHSFVHRAHIWPIVVNQYIVRIVECNLKQLRSFIGHVKQIVDGDGKPNVTHHPTRTWNGLEGKTMCHALHSRWTTCPKYVTFYDWHDHDLTHFDCWKPLLASPFSDLMIRE